MIIDLEESAARAQEAYNYIYQFKNFIDDYITRINDQRYSPYIADLIIKKLPNIFGDSDELTIINNLFKSPFGVKMLHNGLFQNCEGLSDLVRRRVDDFNDITLNLFYIFGNLLNLDDIAAQLILKRTLYKTFNLIPVVDSRFFVPLPYPIEGTVLSSILARKFDNPTSPIAEYLQVFLTLPEINGEQVVIEMLKTIHTDAPLTNEILHTFMTYSGWVTMNPVLHQTISQKAASVVESLPSTIEKLLSSSTHSYTNFYFLTAYNASVSLDIQKKAREFNYAFFNKENPHWEGMIKTGFVTNVTELIEDHPDAQYTMFKYLYKKTLPIPSVLEHLTKDISDYVILPYSDEFSPEMNMRNKYLSFKSFKRGLPKAAWQEALEELKADLIKANNMPENEPIPDEWLLSILETLYVTGK